LTQNSPPPIPHAAYDWQEVARLALASRFMDELEENELTPQGLVTYQFSARGHELGQLLLSQLLTHPLDAASVYYRSRPFMFGSGLTLEEALASDMARVGGVSAGRDVGVVFNMPSRGRAMILPMAGDVGSQFTPAAGWAQAIQYRVNVLGEKEAAGSISVVFGGDGAVATNGFWSALTIATTLKLPLLFVVEDNGYAISVTGDLQTPGSNIAANLASFKNLTIWDGSGTRPAETAELVETAVNHVRQGEGPGLLRLTMPRLSGHSSVDNQAYKTAEQREEEWSHDPIPALHDYLVPALYTEAEWDALKETAETDVRAAAERPRPSPRAIPIRSPNSPFPTTARRRRLAVWWGRALSCRGQRHPGAARTAPHQHDRGGAPHPGRRTGPQRPPARLWRGCGLQGGRPRGHAGLQKEFGEARVFDTSLNEEGIIGRSVGMAYAGLVPVPEIQFRKYADPATEQLNNCGTIRWRTNNRFAAPIVVRIPGGYRKIGDPWHSVTSEIVFAHQPGWLLAFPSNAEDAVGLLRTAMRGNDPVIFFEHRAMLDAAWARRPYPGDDYMLPFGQAKLLREGDELTIVTWGAMVERCGLALEALEGVDTAVDLIDLRTIVPWDKEAVLASVRKTAKCLIVHEDIGLGGFGAEIAATIAAEAFLYLDGPIERVTSPAVPVPFSTQLMEGVVPTVAHIRERIEDLLAF
jgi:2-oxoisovalerate dehydrogenase E1 component